MQHPWVSGSAWMALAPDMSLRGSTRAVLEASPEYRDLVESMAHPLASYNAEEVAAVVFPEMADMQGGWAVGHGIMPHDVVHARPEGWACMCGWPALWAASCRLAALLTVGSQLKQGPIAEP